MAKKYARGHVATGECGRSGRVMLLKDMIFDGMYPNMRVDPAWYEPKHPLENLPRIDDPIALWRPAPENLQAPTPPVLSGVLVSLEGTLTWTEAESGVSQVDTYLLYRSVDSGPYALLFTLEVERDFLGALESALEYVDTDLVYDSTYDYYVIGRAVQGGDSAPSNIVRLAPAIATAPVLSSELLGGLPLTIGLTWTAATIPGSTIEFYFLYRAVNGGAFTLRTTTSSLSFNDEAISAGNTYDYYVIAHPVLGDDSPQSNTVQEITPAACDIELEAGGFGDGNGVSNRPGNSGGTILDTSVLMDSLGTTFAILTIGPGFLQFIIAELLPQDAFDSVTVEEWSETFLSASADQYEQAGGETFWAWFTNVNEFQNGNEYCVILNQGS